jgi:signal peptidase I
MRTTGRGRWECVLWSSQLGGLGQILCGRVRRGVIWLTLTVVINVFIVLSLVFPRQVGFPLIAGGIVLAILLWIAVVVDAYRCGRRQEPESMPVDTNPAWRAAFLSSLIPGLGQLTLRKYRAALIFFGICIMIPLLPTLLYGLADPFCVPLLGLSFPSHEILLMLVTPVAAMAVLRPLLRLARTGKADSESPGFRVPRTLVILILLTTVFIPVGHHALGRVDRSAPTGSMEPTLTGHDVSLGWRLPLWSRDPRRGEIVYAWSGQQFIHKRVVGLPGDVIGLHGTHITVNGREVHLRQDNREDICYSYSPENNVLPLILRTSYRVPPNSFFLLGDNWAGSYDSRYYGAVPREHLGAIVTRTLWPPKHARTLDRHRLRLVRIPKHPSVSEGPHLLAPGTVIKEN